MAKLKNDELNIVSYEQYFGEMEISEKEKQDRIKLAYEFEEYLVWLFLALAAETWTLEEYYRMADEKYCQIAAKYMGVKEIPAYITDYAAEITMSIVDTTLNNKEVDYYLSDERAKAIAANEFHWQLSGTSRDGKARLQVQTVADYER